MCYEKTMDATHMYLYVHIYIYDPTVKECDAPSPLQPVVDVIN